jgi:hypothetical protein
MRSVKLKKIFKFSEQLEYDQKICVFHNFYRFFSRNFSTAHTYATGNYKGSFKTFQISISLVENYL